MNKLYSDSYGEAKDLAYFSEIIFKKETNPQRELVSTIKFDEAI
jgi:hypothetical protein